MNDDAKAPEPTMTCPPPVNAQATLPTDRDPRVAAVLRAVHRAKGCVATSTTFPRSDDDLTEPLVSLGIEIQALREEIATKTSLADQALASVSSDARALKESLFVLRSNFADLQRSVLVATKMQQHQTQEVQSEVSRLAALLAEWRRTLGHWALVVWIVLGGCVVTAVRAYWLARDRHEVLVHILEENQAKTPAAKGAKR